MAITELVLSSSRCKPKPLRVRKRNKTCGVHYIGAKPLMRNIHGIVIFFGIHYTTGDSLRPRGS